MIDVLKCIAMKGDSRKYDIGQQVKYLLEGTE